jgi:glycosyltransferase involved in cell wall biosynthesis
MVAVGASAPGVRDQPRPLPPGRPARLLFIVNVDWFFASHREAIADAAARAGYEVHIACAVTTHGERLRGKGFKVHPLNLERRGTSPVGLLQAFREIRSVIASVRPDIVHAITIKPVLLGGIAARLARVPKVVAAISGMGYVFIARGPAATARRVGAQLLYRLALDSPRVTAILQNPTDRTQISRIAGLGPEQLRTIEGSGVDLQQLTPQPLPAGEPVLTFAARLLIDKGLREFVEAATRLKQGGVTARFIVAGDLDPGNPASVRDDELERWRALGSVEFIGHQKDINALFASSHVVVLPSYREGMPKVLLEAAACGRAVVTTDVPGCRDAVDPGNTALLVPAMTVEPLAEAMRVLIADRARCVAMGEAGRRLAEQRFGIEQVVNAHLAIYREPVRRST